jgi:hypothetical protein
MILLSIVPFLLASFVPCTAAVPPKINDKRQTQDNAAAGNLTNTYASIEPAKHLKWVPCYADKPAAQIGKLECARLIVCLLISSAPSIFLFQNPSMR